MRKSKCRKIAEERALSSLANSTPICSNKSVALTPKLEPLSCEINDANDEVLTDSILFDLSSIFPELESNFTPLSNKGSQKSPYGLRSASKAPTNDKKTPKSSRRKQKRRSKKSNAESYLEFKTQDEDLDENGPFYGLPEKVQEILSESRNITSLFDWQDECLKLSSLQNRRNLIYSLPTSGGKTLVAEILVLKEIINHKRDVLCVFPFVSIVQEKLRGLLPFANEFEFVLDEYAGSKGCIPAKKRRKQTVYVATIEKGHILINSLIEAGILEKMGLIVVDELHMLGESSGRGANLEMMLTKVMHVSDKTQIVGMSATLTNIHQVAEFLNAEVFTSNFRPVELIEMVKFSDSIFRHEKEQENMFVFDRKVNFGYSKSQAFKDPDHIVGLCSEVIPNESCLVFCPSKKNCENVATLICSFMPAALKNVKKEARDSLLSELESDADGNLCDVLKTCIPFGVAYHHSGLTMDERKAIEDAYLQGTLVLLCCTSTLAAGVNLPAKRVIIRSPYVGANFISSTQYKQMIGRAGRAGFSNEGESILVVTKPSDRSKIEDLVQQNVDSCKSSLLSDEQKLKQSILAIIGLNLCKTLEGIEAFLNKTLAAQQQKEHFDLRVCLDELQQVGLVKGEKPDKNGNFTEFQIHSMGVACFKSSLSVELACEVYLDLTEASKSLVVTSHLHLLYLCVTNESIEEVRVDWNLYLERFVQLSESDTDCAKVLGISESMLIRKSTGCSKNYGVKLEKNLARLFCALVLYELTIPKGIWEVSEKFGQIRGFTQNLLSNSSSFCFHLIQFTKSLSEFWALSDLLVVVQQKLSYTVNQDLIPLMEIPRVKYGRAKQLFSAGYSNLVSVAQADPAGLVQKLGKLSFTHAKQIIQGARMILNEKIDSLNDQVEELRQLPQFK